MRIVILGQNRSGTTALFSLLRDSWQATGADPELLFEPHAGSELPGIEADALAKVLFVPDVFDPDAFRALERQILLTRDPRDVLVSHLLYSLRATALGRDPAKAQVFLERLSAKERAPAAVSLRSLFETLFELDATTNWDRYLGRIQVATAWDEDGWYRVRYEDFVDGDRELLSQYVGFGLVPEAVVDARFQRVVRTKTYGLWRDWFTPSDVAFFDPTMRPYCERFDYDADLEPSELPRIAPSHATAYVRRLLAELAPGG